MQTLVEMMPVVPWRSTEVGEYKMVYWILWITVLINIFYSSTQCSIWNSGVSLYISMDIQFDNSSSGYALHIKKPSASKEHKTKVHAGVWTHGIQLFNERIYYTASSQILNPIGELYHVVEVEYFVANLDRFNAATHILQITPNGCQVSASICTWEILVVIMLPCLVLFAVSSVSRRENSDDMYMSACASQEQSGSMNDVAVGSLIGSLLTSFKSAVQFLRTQEILRTCTCVVMVTVMSTISGKSSLPTNTNIGNWSIIIFLCFAPISWKIARYNVGRVSKQVGDNGWELLDTVILMLISLRCSSYFSDMDVLVRSMPSVRHYTSFFMLAGHLSTNATLLQFGDQHSNFHIDVKNIGGQQSSSSTTCIFKSLHCLLASYKATALVEWYYGVLLFFRNIYKVYPTYFGRTQDTTLKRNGVSYETINIATFYVIFAMATTIIYVSSRNEGWSRGVMTFRHTSIDSGQARKKVSMVVSAFQQHALSREVKSPIGSFSPESRYIINEVSRTFSKCYLGSTSNEEWVGNLVPPLHAPLPSQWLISEWIYIHQYMIYFRNSIILWCVQSKRVEGISKMNQTTVVFAGIKFWMAGSTFINLYGRVFGTMGCLSEAAILYLDCLSLGRCWQLNGSFFSELILERQYARTPVQYSYPYIILKVLPAVEVEHVFLKELALCYPTFQGVPVFGVLDSNIACLISGHINYEPGLAEQHILIKVGDVHVDSLQEHNIVAHLQRSSVPEFKITVVCGLQVNSSLESLTAALRLIFLCTLRFMRDGSLKFWVIHSWPHTILAGYLGDFHIYPGSLSKVVLEGKDYFKEGGLSCPLLAQTLSP